MSNSPNLDQDSAFSKPKLYSYHSSSCTWRVRIVMNLKNIDYELISIDIRAGAQNTTEYRKFNPQGQIPSLFINGHLITQSLAIIEYINELYPNPPLLPRKAEDRATARQIAEMIVSGIQPLQKPAVAEMYSDNVEERKAWNKYWIEKGMAAVEMVLQKTSGKYCLADEITVADLCLLPQIQACLRYNADPTNFPNIMRIAEELGQIPSFQRAEPLNQPDYLLTIKQY
jgi:maleylacetoacetate isomerase